MHVVKVKTNDGQDVRLNALYELLIKQIAIYILCILNT